MVKDGSSIMIGGLSKEDKVVDEEAVPFLGKLPIVGGLFTSKNNKSGRSELVILLTPISSKVTSWSRQRPGILPINSTISTSSMCR